MSSRLILVIATAITLLFFMISFNLYAYKKKPEEKIAWAYILSIAIISFVLIFLIISYIYNDMNKSLPTWVLILSIYFPAIPVFISLYFASDGLTKK